MDDNGDIGRELVELVLSNHRNIMRTARGLKDREAAKTIEHASMHNIACFATMWAIEGSRHGSDEYNRRENEFAELLLD